MKFTVHNPIDEGRYADPEARFYNGKYYIYVTHSMNTYEEQQNHTCFVSEDLTSWKKVENIIDMSGFPWVKRAVWAPTVEEKDGKYYYIFASNDIHAGDVGGLEIAVSDNPEGPFKAILDHPLIGDFHNGAQPIDAHLFKDDDGTMYLYYGGWHHCNIVKMNETMTGFVPFENGEIFREITPTDYVEGPCMFKRNGKYYFMWSSGGWTDGTYRVVNAVSDTPWGPFENCHTILSTGDSDFANGPGHNGFLYLPEDDQYLMVYHRHKNEIKNGTARYLCIDRMDMDENGNIIPVVMTKEWEYCGK